MEAREFIGDLLPDELPGWHYLHPDYEHNMTEIKTMNFIWYTKLRDAEPAPEPYPDPPALPPAPEGTPPPPPPEGPPPQDDSNMSVISSWNTNL